MINVRPAELEDLEELVALHYSSGVLGLLSKLNPYQLSVFHYRPLLASPHSSCFVAECADSGEVVGLIAFSTNVSSALNHSLLIRLKVVSRILTQLFRFPDLVPRALNYIAATKFLKSYKSSHECLEIDLLLVRRSAQSSGIGSILMDFFLESVEHKGRIVVQTQNVAALGFYSKFGFNALWNKSLLGVGLWIYERVL